VAFDAFDMFPTRSVAFDAFHHADADAFDAFPRLPVMFDAFDTFPKR
jgi:hypothetical protein